MLSHEIVINAIDEGSKIDTITSQFGLQQLNEEPNHILSNLYFCIDLVFTSQPGLVME